jgi:hypothetical protein
MLPLRRAAVVLAMILALPLGARAAETPSSPPSKGPICDSATALTLIGIDTTTGQSLFSIPAAGKAGTAWVAELDANVAMTTTSARFYPDLAGRFGGSVGPGPVLSAHPCGEGCLQAVRWKAGAWEPLGDPLHVPTATNVTPTWDATGAAWFLIQAPGSAEGVLKVWGFRLEGEEWRNEGSLEVQAVGQPAALPAPQRKDGVLSGTGLFSASGHPEVWVAGLPSLPPSRRGELIALTGSSAAYLSGDGVVYLSDDSGKSWRRSTWTPWGAPEGTVGLWRQGSDYWVDLPFGDHQGALRLVWFDRRVPSQEKVILTRLGRSGSWERLVETGSEVRTKRESMPLAQVLVPRADTWILLSGCAATAGGSGLVLRGVDAAGVSAPKLVPLTPGS